MRTDTGIISKQSRRTVDQTVQTLEALLREKGIKLFTCIDHSWEAQSVGLHINPTKLLIFGSARAGTPLMIATPTVALDLPLKILVSEDDNGKVWISFNEPAYLQERHKFPPELLGNIAVVSALVDEAAK